MYLINILMKLGYLTMVSALYHGELMGYIGKPFVIILWVCCMVCMGVGILSETAMQITEPRRGAYIFTERGFATMAALILFLFLNIGIHYV